MNLNSVWTMAIAWVLAPLLIVLISTGAGLLVEWATGRRLGLSAIPVGFALAIVLMPIMLQLGLPADVAALLFAALAVAGFVLRAKRPPGEARALIPAVRRPGRDVVFALAAAALVQLLLTLPLLMSGRIGILGYYFLNDPSWHTGLIEWLHQHGHTVSASQTSSYEAVSNQISQGYPLGTYAWPLISITFTGASAFALWTSTSAVAMAMVSLVAFAFLRRTGATAPWAAGAATVVSIGYLPLSYYAQGGSKELLFAFTFLLAAYTLAGVFDRGEAIGPRAVVPATIGLASMVYVFGPGAAIWIGPMLVAVVGAALVLPTGAVTRRSVVIATAIGGAATLVLIVPAIVKSLNVIDAVSGVAESGGSIGNLLGAVPLKEVFNAWISYDYRQADPLPQADTWTAALTAAAALMAVVGGIREIAARRWFLPAAAFAGLVAIVFIERNYNAYVAGKAYVTFAPVAGCATAAGILWLVSSSPARRYVGYGLAAAMTLTALVAGSLTYVRVYTTPEQRFEELAAIDQRAAGEGPMLVAEREDYAIGLLRDAGGWNAFSLMTPGIPVREGGGPSLVLQPDPDGYITDHFGQVKLILIRNGPTGSRPPASFEQWFTTDYYTVWRRSGEPPLAHVPVGVQEPDGEGRLQCETGEVADALALAEREDLPVVVSRRTHDPVEIPLTEFTATPGQIAADQYGFTGIPNDTTLSLTTDELEPGTTYRTYIQGAIAPGFEVTVNDEAPTVLSRDISSRENWSPVGEFTAGSETTVQIEASGRSVLTPGSRLGDAVRMIAFVPEGDQWQLTRTDADGAREFCGKTVDWIEVEPEA